MSSTNKEPCQYGSQCYRQSIHHRAQYMHPNDGVSSSDIKPDCRYGTSCYRRNPLHKQQYKHSNLPAIGALQPAFITGVNSIEKTDSNYNVANTDSSCISASSTPTHAMSSLTPSSSVMNRDRSSTENSYRDNLSANIASGYWNSSMANPSLPPNTSRPNVSTMTRDEKLRRFSSIIPSVKKSFSEHTSRLIEPNQIKRLGIRKGKFNNERNFIPSSKFLKFWKMGSGSEDNGVFMSDDDGTEDEDDGENMGVAETYADYMPSKLKLGIKHPDPVVETASLSSVEPTNVWYQLSLSKETIESGALSALQLESITYASQQHEQLLPDGNRAGFLIGDGAGVGKGRTIAGVILENYLKGRKKAIWISVSNDLKYDAERDLKDIGSTQIGVHFLSKFKYDDINSPANGNVENGVIFSTYAALMGETNAVAEHRSRLKQLLHWCGDDFEGAIIFDECHRAKNLCPIGSTKPTKTGKTVLDLQEQLPKARVVYASATGASEPRNMAYMTRLGMWGKGSPFPEFRDFISAVEKRGVGAMEIVAMDMKLRGTYIARQLSFYGVSFKIQELPLSDEFISVYNDSVKLWVSAMQKFEEAAKKVGITGRKRMTMWGQFWSTHQRFFKYLCIASKVQYAVDIARKAIQCGKCVVIGLQSTGEAKTMEQLEREDGELSDFVSTAKGVLESLVMKYFPTIVDRKPGRTKNNVTNVDTVPRKRKLDEFVKSDVESENMSDESETDSEDSLWRSSSKKIKNEPVKQLITNGHTENTNKSEDSLKDDICCSMKEKLLEEIEVLGEKLPPNTLDELIDKLGGPDQVAEMTGRRGRVVQRNSGIQYEQRSEMDVPLETLNLTEKQRFMDGDKLVAIISEAASSGISLQSDRRVRNRRRRVHITLELPWSADRAIQQFGRTHRSNQVNAPEYIFLISDLAGERRFASIVAKRLESLGALTHGDRRATETRDLSRYNIDNKYGRSALVSTMRAIMGLETPLVPQPVDYKGDFFGDIKNALVGVGMVVVKNEATGELVLSKDHNSMTKFLNRILGTPVNLQNSLFQYFTDTLSAVIKQAKKSGRFDLGILDIGTAGEGVKRVKLYTFERKHSTGIATTELHVVYVERGFSWDEAMKKYYELSDPKEGFYLSIQVRNNRKTAVLAISSTEPSLNSPPDSNNKRNMYILYRPNTGLQLQQESLAELEKKYKKAEVSEALEHWKEQYDISANTCSHAYWSGRCKSVTLGRICEIGLRRRTYNILSGSVFSVWDRVENVLTTETGYNAKMQVVRMKTTDGIKIVGTLIPTSCVKSLRQALALDAENFGEQTFE